jgi:peroxiredoxin
MVELGELEAQHPEFDKRNVRVIVVSNDNLSDSQRTQNDLRHLTVVSDADQNLARAVQVVHAGGALGGGDTSTPTTFLIDGAGTVRWVFRPDGLLSRASAEQLLAAVDEHLRTQK